MGRIIGSSTHVRVQGNHWEFIIAIEDADGNAFDCTNYESVMVIKKLPKIGEPLISADIVWTNQASGEGSYTFTPAQTKDIYPLDTGTYRGECYLYKDDSSFNESVARIPIKVVYTLSIDHLD